MTEAPRKERHDRQVLVGSQRAQGTLSAESYLWGLVSLVHEEVGRLGGERAEIEAKGTLRTPWRLRRVV